MEYGDLSVTFSPEIFEEEQEVAEAPVPVNDTRTQSAQEAPDKTPDTSKTADAGMTLNVSETADAGQAADAGNASSAGRSADTEKPSDTEQAPDTEKPSDTEQAPDTEKPLDTEQAPDTEKPSDTEQASDTAQDPDTEKAAGAEDILDTEAPDDAGTALPDIEPGREISGVSPETEPESFLSTEGLQIESEAGDADSQEDNGETEIIPDSTVRYRELENGVKEEVVIYGYRGGHRVDYDMELQGLTPQQSGNSFKLLDEEGKECGEISAPYLYDEAGAVCHDVAVSMGQTGENKWKLSYIPSDAWLSDESRVWPVVLDPTVTIDVATEIEDNYVHNGSSTQNPFDGTQLIAGNKGGSNYTAYIRPAIPESLKNIASSVIILDAKVKLHVDSQSGNQNYRFYKVNEEWNSRTITGKNAPSCDSSPFLTRKLSKGNNTVDIKELVSTWFNCLDQHRNCGFAIKGSGTKGSYVSIASSDHGDSDRVTFTIKYDEIKKKADDPGLTVTAGGNDPNSGTGYVNLSWADVSKAEGYYVGIFNGKGYEYFWAGNTNSFTTKGKGIWPTQAEISSGRYLLHGDGTGGELPCIPAFTYENYSGTKYKGSMEYFFRIVPANEYKQAINPGTFAVKSTVLPDRIAPQQAASVLVSPDTYSNKQQLTVTWSGIKDFNTTSASITTTLGTGCVQYSIDGTGNWVNTTSNAASGSYALSIAGCGDGEHTIYVRGCDSAGNTGAPKGVKFYVDRTGPTGQSLLLQPEGYTAENTVSLSWSGMKDINQIVKIEYRIDDGPWTDTQQTAGSCSGYMVDITGLSEGRHTLELRGHDKIGNIGAAASAQVLVDRTAPIPGTVFTDPEGWTAADEVTLGWKDWADAVSGIELLEYNILGEWKDTGRRETEGSFAVDMSGWEDGEYPVIFRAADYAGNVSGLAWTELLRDTTPPEILITAPADEAMLDGEISVTGYVTDGHLEEWSISARDSADNEKELAKGTEEIKGDILGSLDLSAYPDGENVTVTVRARDLAGNEAEKSILLIRVGGSMETLETGIKLDFPEMVTQAQEQGSYSPSEGTAYIYVDSALAEQGTSGSFLVDGVRYEEGSTHRLSAVLESADGKVAYSDGLGGWPLFDKVWAGGAPVDGGIWDGGTFAAVRPMVALRLNVTDFTPGKSSIRYEYSVDGGDSWHTVIPDQDVAFGNPVKSVKLRALFTSDDVQEPQLYRVCLQGVIQTNPRTFTVKLSKTAGRLQVTAPDTATYGKTDIKSNPDSAAFSEARWYLDGMGVPFSDSKFNALYVQEDGSASLSGAGLTSEGSLFTTGGGSQMLLRQDLGYITGQVESEDIKCSGKIVAIRLEAAARDGSAVWEYSTDKGKTWKTLKSGVYTLLDGAASTIRLRGTSSGAATLAGWFLEGYTQGGYTVKADLAAEPTEVTAVDYGALEKNSGSETGSPRYEITWRDTQGRDTTASYSTYYEIYRDGTLLDTADDSSYIDRDYRSGASYSVCKVRRYAGDGREPYTVRRSARIPARIVIMQDDKAEAAKKELEEYEQAPALTSLYGGKHTFVLHMDPPDADLVLNQALLGKSKYCSLGFEPVNFNTGNFVLEAEDYKKEMASGPETSLLRTYNAQSTDTDGPFGAKWASQYSQYLNMYQDTTIGYRKADGALVLFENRDDGYVCGTDDHLRLEKEGDGFKVTEPEGRAYHFSHFGLLTEISEKGRSIFLERDERSVLSRIVLSDGTALTVETDELGRITGVALPDGASVTYGYDGNNLVSVTDELGNTVRYVYDAEGRMTEWYDKAGNRQVYNEYDGADRVIRQIDAKEGEYTLQYFEDHTVATDAQGGASEIWYDEKLRTVREVNPEGGEYLYIYDEAGNLCGRTDPEGRLTSYTFDENGNQTGTVLPDGTKLSWVYDENGNLLLETDGNGNETRYEYDGAGRLVKTAYADGGEELRAYDEEGRLVQETNPLGAVTTYEYEKGLLTAMTDALGGRETYEYDGAGRVTAVTAADGSRTEYRYDAAGRLTMERSPEGAETFYSYDEKGSLASETDALGGVTEYIYDALGNCIQTIYPDSSSEKKEYNASGLPASETDALGNTKTYEYDGAGNLISETDALGRTTLYTYNGSGLMTSMTLPTGAAEEYEYDAVTGLLIRSVDASGRELRLEYDPEGNITAQYDGEGLIQAFAYDCMGRLARETDALGNTTCYEYDLAGNLTKVTDALGNETSYSYDLLGRRTGVTDALGHTATWEYDLSGNCTGATDAAGHTAATEYDSMGRMIREVAADGGENTYIYDAAGNLTGQSFPEGGSVSWGYDGAGQQVSMTDVFGRTAQMEYDLLGNMVRTGEPEGTEISYTYDAAGNLLEMADENGSVTAYIYDELGRILTVTTEDSSMTYGYDRNGNVTSIRDGSGAEAAFTYDGAGNLTGARYPDGSEDVLEYDALGRLIRSELRDGSSASYLYDAAGNVTYQEENGVVTTREYDLLGNVTSENTGGSTTSYTYDALGNVTSETDDDGRTIRYEYDSAGNRTAYILPEGARLELEYDRNGRLTASRDALGDETRYAYDLADRLVSVTDAMGGVTSYEYDNYDNIQKVTDALGHTTEYTYDALGQVLSETDALGNTQSYSYTDEGWLASKTDARGQVTEYTYDTVGNLLSTLYGDGTKVTNNWDVMGRLVSTGVTGAEEAGTERIDGKTSYKYDKAGRVTGVIYPDGSRVSYEYNEAGDLLVLAYPNGEMVEYTYDSVHRLISAKDSQGKEVTYTYDSLGRRISASDGTNTTEYTYDGAGNLTAMHTTGQTDLELAYTYDANGNLLSESRRENGETVVSTYAYDPLGRLSSWETSDGLMEKYTYDAAGNMTTKDTAADTITMAYDEANRLISMTSSEGTAAYTYDADGNLTCREIKGKADTYRYDYADRLADYTGADGTEVGYAYSAEGYLLAKSTTDAEGSSRTSYTYDVTQENAQVLTETTGNTASWYTYGVGRTAAYIDKGGSTEYTSYLYDVQGSVIETLTAAEADSESDVELTTGGNAARPYRYTPYGELVAGEEGQSQSGLLYNGEFCDGVTGMIYLRARWYTPAEARFFQPDIVRGDVSAPQLLNRYAYVRNNPVRYADPSGELLSEKAELGSGAVAVGNIRAIQAGVTAGAVGGTASVSANYVLRHRTVARVSIQNTRSRAASASNSAASKAAQYRWYKTQAVQKAKNLDPVSSVTAKTISKGTAEKRRTYEPLNVPVVPKGKAEVFPRSNVEKARNDGIRARKPSLSGDGSDGGCIAERFPAGTGVVDKPHLHVFPWNKADKDGIRLSGNTNSRSNSTTDRPIYRPSPKHNPVSGWGSQNPIPNVAIGQALLDTAYSSSTTKQLYNIYNGELIKFQPDTVEGWHAYLVKNTSLEVPVEVLRQMRIDGVISRAQYKKFTKNKEGH